MGVKKWASLPGYGIKITHQELGGWEVSSGFKEVGAKGSKAINLVTHQLPSDRTLTCCLLLISIAKMTRRRRQKRRDEDPRRRRRS